jgi:cyclic pyranopterin monophosphate synthase
VNGPTVGRGGGGELTHVDRQGKARIVDITGKVPTVREAEARCSVVTAADLDGWLTGSGLAELIESARFAAMLAAKQTAVLIPLCHPIRIDGITVDVRAATDGFRVRAVATITERTGVEMEALTACTVAGLVLLQPLLEVDPDTSVEGLTLWRKTGGRSGTWRRTGDPEARGPQPDPPGTPPAPPGRQGRT